MIALLSRKYWRNMTTGRLVALDGDKKLVEVVTIELPDNGNMKNVSCIPEGTYECERIISPSKGECFHVNDVPGRSHILIHVGNYAAGKKVDTEGCILPGLYFYDINDDGFTDVVASTSAMKKLLKALPDKFKLIITS